MIWIERNGIKIEFDGTVDEFHNHAFYLTKGFIESTAPDAAATEPPYVPQSISRAKGLIMLKRLGMLESVKAIVASKDIEDGESQIIFDNALTFDRSDDLLIYVATALGKTSADLDQMFIDGEALWA